MDKQKKQLSILIVSNFTVAHFFVRSLHEKLDDEFMLKLDFADFSPEIEKYYLINYDCIILWFNIDVLGNNSDQNNVLELFYKEIKKVIKAKIFWIGFDTINTLENMIYGDIFYDCNIAQKNNNIITNFLDNSDVFIYLDHIISKVSYDKAYDWSYKYRWNCIYTRTVFMQLAIELRKQLLKDYSVPIKCIVLDCDNVLWGGILSEVGYGNIKLGEVGDGKIYSDFQKAIMKIYNHGMLLAVASKNDYDEVINVFDSHSGMILHKDNIAYFSIHWENKVKSIVDIATKLNIHYSNIIFIDDSEYEIAMINNYIPEVRTILFEKYGIFQKFNEFTCSPLIDANTVKIRNDTYKNNIIRNQKQDEFINYDDFIEYLMVETEIKISTTSEGARISELSLRTNRITNGMRYSAKDIQNILINKNYINRSIYASDRFGNLGLVGALIIDAQNPQENVLELICLSCRVLGRNIENKMIDFVKEVGISKIKMQATNKNDIFLVLLNQELKCN